MSITKILLSEAVSTGKRLALMEKILKLYNEWFYVEDTKKVMGYINDNPRDVDEMIRSKIGYPRKAWKLHQGFKGSDKYGEDNIFVAAIVIKFFKVLEETDPTNNMKYGNWLVDVVMSYAFEKGMFGNRLEAGKDDVMSNMHFILSERGTFFQDMPKMHSYLSYYDEAKRKNELPEALRDITKLIDNFNKIYPDAGIHDPWHVLNHVTEEFRTKYQGDVFQNIKERLKEGVDYEYYGEADGFKIYHPLTQKGASILGTNTEWCTTYGEHCSTPDYQGRTSYFDGYEDLIILIDISDPEIKYQFSFDSSEYMDQDDVPVDMKDFFDQNPKAVEQIIKYSKSEDENWIEEVVRFADLKKHPWIGEYILNSLEHPKIDEFSKIGLYKDERGWFVGFDSIISEVRRIISWDQVDKLHDEPTQMIKKYLRDKWRTDIKYLERNVDNEDYQDKAYIDDDMALEWILEYNGIDA